MKNTTNDWFLDKLKRCKRCRNYRFLKSFFLYNVYNLKSILLTGQSLDELNQNKHL